MGRPPLAVGTYGKITTTEQGDGWRAKAYVRDADGRRREVSRWRDTRAGAERALRAALKDRQVGGTTDLGPETRYEVVLERWLAMIADDSRKSVNTKDLYRKTATNHVGPALGGLRLRELTVPRIDAALQAIRAASGHGTAKTSRSVLSGSVGLAVRLGAIPTNPIRDASPISADEDAKEPRALTLEEQLRVQDMSRTLQRAVDLDLADLIDWMLGTGMRIGEALAIRDDCLDLEAGTVEVNATVVRVRGAGLVVQDRPKSDAGWRVLALPPDLVDMLRRRRTELRLAGPARVPHLTKRGKIVDGPGGIIFTSPAGRLRDPSNTLADLREVLDAIDRPQGEDAGPFAWVTSHVFRKTVATRLDEAGLSARQIADVLGHKRPSMTQDVYMGRKVVSADAAAILVRPKSDAT